MKLVIIIIQDEDASKLMESFMQQKIGVTRMASTGGFLRRGNTTLLVGAHEGDLPAIYETVERLCKRRKQFMTPTATELTLELLPMPIEIEVGGATLFVLDCDMKKI